MAINYDLFEKRHLIDIHIIINQLMKNQDEIALIRIPLLTIRKKKKGDAVIKVRLPRINNGILKTAESNGSIQKLTIFRIGQTSVIIPRSEDAKRENMIHRFYSDIMFLIEPVREYPCTKNKKGSCYTSGSSLPS